MFSHIDNSCTCAGKWCSSCGQIKCLGAFNRNRSMKDGLDNYCRVCKSEWLIAYRQGNLEPIRERRERAKSSEAYRYRGIIPQLDHIKDNCNCPGKRCPGCEQIKCHDAFNRDKRAKSGLQVYCRACQSAKSVGHYQSDLESRRERARERDRTESHREYQKNWRQGHFESRRAYHKAYKEAHPDYGRMWSEENRDKVREYSRTRYRNHPELSRISVNNRRARKKQAEGAFTQREWESLCAYYGYTCLHCGRREPDIKLTADHVVPLAQGGSNDISNIQPLCHSCNARKHTAIIDYRLDWGR
jgi:5-methylcytosine-specific restriction endonuclease McrA